MTEPSSIHGQPDAVRLRDEDGTFEVLERAVRGLWYVVAELTRLRRTRRAYMLRPALPLANAEDIAIPRCVGSV